MTLGVSALTRGELGVCGSMLDASVEVDAPGPWVAVLSCEALRCERQCLSERYEKRLRGISSGRCLLYMW